MYVVACGCNTIAMCICCYVTHAQCHALCVFIPSVCVVVRGGCLVLGMSLGMN